MDNLKKQSEPSVQTKDILPNDMDLDRDKDNLPLVGFVWAIIAVVLLGLAASNNLMLPVYRQSVIFTVLYVLSTVFAIIALIFNIKGERMANVTKGQKIMSIVGLVLSTLPIIVAILGIGYFLLALAVV